jgi:ferrous iron transport protein B
MELPPYRAPMLKSLLIHMWDRSRIFLKKMGGVILVGSVVIWFLTAFPRTGVYSRDYAAEAARATATYDNMIQAAPEGEKPLLEARKDEDLAAIENARQAERIEYSLMGRIGKALAPVFVPLGIDWRGGVALVSGFVAKEIVVSTLGVLYAADEAEESDALRSALKASGMSPLSALSMMIFVLLYLPCLATVTAIRRETGSLKWMFFSIFYSTSMAWIAAFCVYQGGSLLGFK